MTLAKQPNVRYWPKADLLFKIMPRKSHTALSV
jgi:hypothetical protein